VLLFFAKLAILSGGTFHSVDIDPEISEKSKKMFGEILGDEKILHYIGDSVSFLKKLYRKLAPAAFESSKMHTKKNEADLT
jgi:hypothetical protein